MRAAAVVFAAGAAAASSCSSTADRIIGAGSIAEHSAADAGECCDQCTANSACLAYTFVAASKQCYLKDNAADEGSADGRVSGAPAGRLPRGYGCASNSTDKWCDVSLSVQERAAALTAAMTVAEKAGQLQGRGSVAVPRLGVPYFCWGQNVIDRVYAAKGESVTRFPIPAGMGATFNDSATESMAKVFATEARSLFNTGEKGAGYICPGSLVAWGPTVNINRDPRWGRNWESPGEDPTMVARYTKAFVRGAQQGEDARFTKMVVTVKHWAAYSVENYKGMDRYHFDAEVSAEDLNQTYFPAFKAAAEVKAGGIMCSYNAVNGVPACFSQPLKKVLRGEYGYTGYVTSDTDAISTANNKHHYVNTDADRVRLALEAGTDMESSVGSENLFATLIPELVANGTLNESLVDAAVERTLVQRLNLGMFDPPADQPYAKIGAAARGTPESAKIALDAARQVVTLLQNRNQTLPWPKGGSVAVIGPLSGPSSSLPKDFIYPDIAAGVRKVDPTADVTVVSGCSVQGSDKAGFAAAVAAAKKADRVVLALGSDTNVEREAKDRTSISLPGVQEDLALQVLAAGRPTAVVLVTMGSISVDTLKAKADAIMVNHYTQDGVAAAEVLFGDTNPSAKLPYTVYPAAYAGQVDFLNMSMRAGPGRSHRYYTGTPLWPFGFGLSYTTFALRHVESNAAGHVVEVRNTGSRHGAEVVQMYATVGGVRSLVDYQKVAVESGSAATVRFARAEAVGEVTFTNGADQIVRVQQ